ncbi:hypothetical protein V8V91_18810 [Algoriphagus halophilus]
MNSENLQKQEEIVKLLGKKVKRINFSGGHIIDSEVLKDLFEKNEK